MKIRLQMIIETDDGEAETIEEIGRLERGPLRPEDLGLRIAEAKGLLHGMQKSLVTAQITDYLAGFKTCPHCAAPRTSKGQHSVAYRTVFGKIHLSSPRLYEARREHLCKKCS